MFAIPVMPGLIPGIHAVPLRVSFRTRTIAAARRCAIFGTLSAHWGVDGRDKPGHDGIGAFSRPKPRIGRLSEHKWVNDHGYKAPGDGYVHTLQALEGELMATLIKGLLIAVVGLALGLWSARASLSDRFPIAVDKIGAWRVEARAGAANADPYTRARVERAGEVPLALGEGLRMTTRTDSDGRALDPRCVYKVGPRAPPARYWTLELVDGDGGPVANPAERYVLRSSEILRAADGGFSIFISARAHAGNWLPIGAPVRFGLALRLYDPALSGALGVDEAAAPIIAREHCG
jgi:hypothetical protein